MHTVELTRSAIEVAETLGYGIRHEWLGGVSGGACQVGQRRWLFIDLALDPPEQLDQIITALLEDPRIHGVELPPPLLDLMRQNRAA